MKKLIKDHPWAERVPGPEWLKRPVLRFYDRFVKLQGDPNRLARGLALGIFIGFTPTMGIQMPIALLVAALLHQSKIAAMIGVWISNPLTAPILYGFTYFVGTTVLGMPLSEAFRMPHTWAELKLLSFDIFLPLWVGGILSGAVAYLPTYHFGLQSIRGYRAARSHIRGRRAKRAGTSADAQPPDDHSEDQGE
jgi:uncharacterized protein (DUF2062 family)